MAAIGKEIYDFMNRDTNKSYLMNVVWIILNGDIRFVVLGKQWGLHEAQQDREKSR